jgi:hypothetical protein
MHQGVLSCREHCSCCALERVDSSGTDLWVGLLSSVQSSSCPGWLAGAMHVWNELFALLCTLFCFELAELSLATHKCVPQQSIEASII